MKTNKKGIDLIEEFESCHLEAYKIGDDPWTIGWGATTYEDGSRVKKGDSISQERADALFIHHLERFEKLVMDALGNTVLNPNQFSALVSIMYNVGPGYPRIRSGIRWLETGRPSTLLSLIKHNQNDPLIAKEFVKWISKGSIFEKGLLRRREAEVNLYFS